MIAYEDYLKLLDKVENMSTAIDSLVTQVGDLETRVEALENPEGEEAEANA